MSCNFSRQLLAEWKLGDKCKKEINDLVYMTHDANKKWWKNPKTGESLDVDALVPTKLMLIVSELSEAMEGHRKNIMDTHLTDRKMFEVELSDAIIRLMDLAGATGIDLGGAYVDKMIYNSKREDHTDKARLAEGGKRY